MEGENFEVTCPQGKLRGLVKKSSGQNTTSYFSFQGIPYAKPPVGPLRFKAPEPFGRWDGVRDATKAGNDSVQKHMLLQYITGDENCLYINVYTTQVCEKAKKAVMVWIHGGGFISGTGSSEIHGPDYLIEHDIVLVTVNYRLGALGFLSLENEKVPGNNGLKDQALALRWVKDNITSFGGDPNNVTIFGESAGGISVHYHILSPASAGLFHKAILQSGNAAGQSAFQAKPRECALMLAKNLGCSSEDLDQVLEFFMSVPAVDFVNAQDKLAFASDLDKIHNGGLTFSPCIEVSGSNPFMAENPHTLLESGKYNKVPIIIGLTDKEGLFSLSMKRLNFDKLNEDPSLFVPPNLKKLAPGSAEAKEVGKRIRQFYINTDKVSWDVVHGIVDFVSDAFFFNAVECVRQSQLRHAGPVYTYLFSYKAPGAVSPVYVTQAFPDRAEELLASGVGHGDELVMQFRRNIPQLPIPTLSSQDYAFIHKFLRAWTSFAKTGNPNCEEIGWVWEADDLITPHHLVLGQELKSVNDVPFSKRVSFWREMYGKYS